jgi:UDP-N-acetylmuramate dehydrogenase
MIWFRGFEPTVRQKVPLAPMTTYRIGGPAEFYAEPADPVTLGQLLSRAANEKVGVRFLGHGTNLLVADEGVGGLVIRLPKSFGYVYRKGTRVRVGAGHSLPGLVKWAASQGLSGLECLQGVPGTVGAALRMNAGGKYGEICSRVRRVFGFERDGTAFDLAASDCGFTYRDSGLAGRIVAGCELDMEDGDPMECRDRMDQILREKCATQPLKSRSAGCVFKNVKTPDVPPTGKIIDELGFKGFRIGGASVSTLHANFLICAAGASSRDLIGLIRMIRERVWQERGIVLDTEIEIWGIEAEELMPRSLVKVA